MTNEQRTELLTTRTVTVTVDELAELAVAAFHEKLVDNYIIHSCINCEHFTANGDLCAKVAQRPPARVIVYGCEEWDMKIPF